MKITRAEAMGFCFGVRDALQIADSVSRPERVTIHGELVHNEVVLEDLRRRGFTLTGEAERDIPATEEVLVTAHGISDRERRRLEGAGKTLVDTTCPLVKRAHDAGLSLAHEDRLVVVVGKPDHVEVRGLTEDLDDFVVVRGPEDLGLVPAATPRLGLLAQTTTPPELFAQTEAALRAAHPAADIRVADTVCHPTRRRQEALARLVEETELVIVVGGRNSNNTRRLVENCRRAGVRAHRVSGPEELRPEWFEGLDRVGLTAGTSTPDRLIDAVEEALRSMADALPLQN
jgi:4-hydroxy-3-methylbut-2-en-1-yl diphosphate reductase